MLWRCADFKGYQIAATDGSIGAVDDLLFDEAHWTLRWLVADTGGWLSGRKMLATPQWIRDIDWAERRVAVDLTREAVRTSPEYDPRASVEPRYEASLHGPYAGGRRSRADEG
ncbi:MAG TPA: PRC-barrel domain-containing protein [Stellaceae bacterium]|jgi:uncharacterized protein YrrD|nr:PRC-barrel domain-containing protein [Stellaceae bacterium]